MGNTLSSRTAAALEKWRTFAHSYRVNLNEETQTWANYSAGPGYVDEERIIQPSAFPAFASQLLGWTLQLNLAPEQSGAEGKPDFTPADSVTHPFVFETKSTKAGTALLGHEDQVGRYLTEGSPRIRSVVLTNLVGLRVFSIDSAGAVFERYSIPLRGLLDGPLDVASKLPDARRLADFFDEFSRKELSADEKLQKVRESPPWTDATRATNSDWILGRLDRVVSLMTTDVMAQIRSGILLDRSQTQADERKWILQELRSLADRIGLKDAELFSIDDFTSAGEKSLAGKALQQFGSHVAYYATTRLMLVRVWEDLGLLEPMLYDGGFDKQMSRFDNALEDVIGHSYARAQSRYRDLFDQRNSYTWFQPSRVTYAEAIYELANTYLGAIESDVLGEVYERMLERIDRKLLGAYYTPRDIISLIWDLIDFETLANQAEHDDRILRVFDIATGSGGFLVEAAQRLRQRVALQVDSGATVSLQQWVNEAADGLNGVEINRFSAYLAELNLLVQFGQVVAQQKSLRIPPMGILSGDSLSLHNPVTLVDDWDHAVLPNDLISNSEDRKERALRIKSPVQANFLMDVACGNPPYIGEKTAAPMMAKTRRAYPYWESFVGSHMDYLYWFLILGVSKLRRGGKFGFITTEYWLRAEGAKPLREYLAARCTIDRIVLFRDMRLFPDAPGQHSMIITGTRVADPDGDKPGPDLAPQGKPRISIYTGGRTSRFGRRKVLRSILRASSNSSDVRHFTSLISPNALKSTSWADVVLDKSQLAQRAHLTQGQQVEILASEGVITTANSVTAKTEPLLSGEVLPQIGGPGSKAGVQLLTQAEVSELRPLTETETRALRLVINTKDVYPYAVVPPRDAAYVVYLPKPEVIDPRLHDDQVRSGLPFPADMPNLESHLSKFRPILESKARTWGERRPWWSLHRARTEIVDSANAPETGWSNYCVVSRWGSGGKFVAGLAPTRVSPASGLHAIRAAKDVVPASYLAALYNSSLYQEIAESLPPGQLRKADLERIGIPLRPQLVDAISEISVRLATSVTGIVRIHSERFPSVGEALRQNCALVDPMEDRWLPLVGPNTHWGKLERLAWVESIKSTRAGSTGLGTVFVTETLLGNEIQISERGSVRPAATVTLSPDTSLAVAEALAASIRAYSDGGGKVRGLPEIMAPLRADSLAELFRDDRESLLRVVDAYRADRKEIDSLLERFV